MREDGEGLATFSAVTKLPSKQTPSHVAATHLEGRLTSQEGMTHPVAASVGLLQA